MRLRNALALGATAATTGTAALAFACPSASASASAFAASASAASETPASEASASAAGSERRDKPPLCGKATDPDFPLATRIHGGPTLYVPGGDPRSFAVDLTNTTDRPCSSIHPVLVLADRDRVLRPAQIQLDFYDTGARRWRPVPFEETEEDENIGVFTGFPGFEVPAGGTLTIPVRLAFRADAAPNEVVAGAAIVQRQGDDGDWVGESRDYRLRIGPEGTEESGDGEETEKVGKEKERKEEVKGKGKEEVKGKGKEEVKGKVKEEVKGRGREEGEGATPVPEATAPPRQDASDGASDDTGLPPVRPLPELAVTGGESAGGRESVTALAPVSAGLALTGTALLIATRRRRHP
ncbi:hypothetical protein J7E93_24515 [Streptomyces sp. ISL-36]|uniref:hypothetical protein n=1 Tax=Streptomyces sp. ISL-36 TaxID=2819182 RepID=UPI001BE85A88|nr:hypothetical protein [Streptomyces sp. ISL-36]MBT2443199.1 hypothetical protein [Streptomyces sp. ISL-36]